MARRFGDSVNARQGVMPADPGHFFSSSSAASPPSDPPLSVFAAVAQPLPGQGEQLKRKPSLPLSAQSSLESADSLSHLESRGARGLRRSKRYGLQRSSHLLAAFPAVPAHPSTSLSSPPLCSICSALNLARYGSTESVSTSFGASPPPLPRAPQQQQQQQHLAAQKPLRAVGGYDANASRTASALLPRPMPFASGFAASAAPFGGGQPLARPHLHSALPPAISTAAPAQAPRRQQRQTRHPTPRLSHGAATAAAAPFASPAAPAYSLPLPRVPSTALAHLVLASSGSSDEGVVPAADLSATADSAVNWPSEHGLGCVRLKTGG